MWPKCPLHFCSDSPQVSQVPDLLDVPYTKLSTISVEKINTPWPSGFTTMRPSSAPFLFDFLPPPSKSNNSRVETSMTLCLTISCGDLPSGESAVSREPSQFLCTTNERNEGGDTLPTHKIPNLISLMRLGTLWTTCSLRNSPELGTAGSILLPNRVMLSEQNHEDCHASAILNIFIIYMYIICRSMVAYSAQVHTYCQVLCQAPAQPVNSLEKLTYSAFRTSI